MSAEELRRAIEELAREEEPARERALPVVDALLEALEHGRVRAAEAVDGEWVVWEWVKRGILLAFRVGKNREFDLHPVFFFRDRDTFPTLDLGGCPETRIVPGGTTVRRGAFLGRQVVIMPPAFVNVGAYVGDGSMIDSHALVGSCAQIGRAVHLSAGAQVGGVLEPVGAMPVVVEDHVFVGGGRGVFEGTRVGEAAVLAAGVCLTRGVPVYDLVRQTVHRAQRGSGLVVPAGAVVVPGSRPARGEFACEHGIQVQCPVIVKYRDGSTDAGLILEEALR